MDISQLLLAASASVPVALMVTAALLTRFDAISTARLWRIFQALSACALILAVATLLLGSRGLQLTALLQVSPLSLTMAVLVQLLGTVIGAFSARYLQGEAGQRRYVAALAAVLAAVHLLLMADHWVVLIAAWALVGVALQHLLCFYPERAFARLAAHKKRIADRAADGLLVGAAAIAWLEVGSGSFSALWAHIGREGLSTAMQFSALALVLAVILRTALLPVHGWLIQVMEAPTPVSALLHAGVINLGGFVLIRFAPMLEQAMPARILLLVFGLTSAVFAGMVMLTRISIKVRLAWSTVAQMGFMLLECALGLYTLAILHLIGHSIYKAHAFLSASTAVRQTRLQALHTVARPAALSLVPAPVLTVSLVLFMHALPGHASWPWWWSAVLGLAWAPLLWQSSTPVNFPVRARQMLSGLLMVSGLTVALLLAHALPFGIQDAPQHALGVVALLGMVALYFWLALLQLWSHGLSSWRRWSYAGFYMDELYTRAALQLWPARWGNETNNKTGNKAAAASLLPDAAQ